MAYTTVDNPELFFQTKTYSGTGSSNSITLDGSENMQPDWVWIKNRQQAINFMMWDSVRGTTKYFYSNLNEAEGTSSSIFTSFDSDGFTVGNNNNVNQSSNNIVAWNWKASGSTSSNSNGSITSTISANTTAGFSIVTWTGNATSGATLGHGLGVKPAMIISKNRDEAQNWFCYHKSLGATDYIRLNLTNASGSATSIWNDTEPTTSVFSVGNDTATNGSSDKIVAYCFADVKGFSKFGTYTGNGNDDGTYVHLGFRPAFVMTKRTNSTSHWLMKDNKRDPFNVSDTLLVANDNDSESNWGTGRKIDFLSNGFKARSTSTGLNVSGSSYIYLAFAESPFVNSSGVPNNAR